MKGSGALFDSPGAVLRGSARRDDVRLELDVLMRLEAAFVRFESRLVAAILALGFVGRIAWLFLDPDERMRAHRSEMWHVAAHWAATGTIGDAYGGGSGVSSHVGPFNTILAGLVYRAFGLATPTAELVLSLIAAAVAIALFWTLYRVAAALDIPVVPRLAALAFLALVPVNFYYEVVDFRVRESALAALMSAALLLWLLWLDAAKRLDWRPLAGFGVAAAFAFMVNPSVAIPAYLGLGFVALRHMPVIRWPAAALVLLAGFALVNGPWVARNLQVYDRVMLSRGNFGMELATANHAAAVDPADPQAVFLARLQEVSPFFSPEAYARFKAYPRDVDYFDMWGAEAKAWIAANPGDFARITLRHLRELTFPPAWQWNQYGTNTSNRSAGVKQAMLWTITALAFAALAAGLLERPRRYLFVALTLACPAALYIIVQPTLRYRYLFAGLLAYLAAAFAWRLVAGWRAGTAARTPAIAN